MTTELAVIARESMKKGSLSFYLASQLLPRKTREATFLLYSWCRYCDDYIDEAPTHEAQERIQWLENQTSKALLSSEPVPVPFLALRRVANTYNIATHYPLDLLKGMRWDVEGRNYQTQNDLMEYCYCVAGTVGGMMAGILGVQDRSALKYAEDLGRAMQLTNIARDIYTDFKLARCYLPKDWLKEYKLEAAAINNIENNSIIRTLQNRLVDLADIYYHSGSKGYNYLTFFHRFAIIAAALIYRQIGFKLAAFPKHLKKERMVVSTPEKLAIVVKSLWQLLRARYRFSPLPK